MAVCLICESGFTPFLSFGKMPIANGFLTKDQFQDEYFFELKVGFCPNCELVQLAELVEREKMFHENYAFFSSTSTRMAMHFREFAGQVLHRHAASGNPFVVEIGSNDGILLHHFAKKGIRHLGVEPSANVAQVAMERGVRTVCEFFDEALADRIASGEGQADAILGANVICHIPYLHSLLTGVKRLLKPGGVFVFEDPYLGDIVEKTSYDQIYDEHAFYFSVSSVANLVARHGLEVVDAEPQDVHGGSMRYTIAHQGARGVSPAVEAHREKERVLGLHRRETYDRFRQNIERSRKELVTLLQDLKKEGKRVVGYGATSKSTTVTNYCGITPDLVEFISDTTPIKQGKYSPGAHIPVRPYEEFAARLSRLRPAVRLEPRRGDPGQGNGVPSERRPVHRVRAGSSHSWTGGRMILCGNPREQYLSHKSQIDEAVRKVLDGGRYILGEEVGAFESEFAAYIGVPYGIGVGSGTEALHVALAACGIGRGDEVVTVSHTAVATAAAIELAGAAPVFVDIEPGYFTIDPAAIERAITPRTRAIIPVHLYGQPADLGPVLEVARRHGLRVIEDCAQAHGAIYRGARVGSFGDVACFSFYPTKNLGGIGDGGMVLTNDPDIARKVAIAPGVRVGRPVHKRRPRLEFPPRRVAGRDPPREAPDARCRQREERRTGGGIRPCACGIRHGPSEKEEGCSHVFHLYVVRSGTRDVLRDFLKSREILAIVHYPVPVHLQPAYGGRRTVGALEATVAAAREVISLPLYPELRPEEVLQVAGAVKEAAGRGITIERYR